jgi:hypothetical protein
MFITCLPSCWINVSIFTSCGELFGVWGSNLCCFWIWFKSNDPIDSILFLKHVQQILMCMSLNLKKVTCLASKHPWRSPLIVLLLENFLYSKGCQFSHQHVSILFLGDNPMKINFQILFLWSIRCLVKIEHVFNLVGVLLAL